MQPSFSTPPPTSKEVEPAPPPPTHFKNCSAGPETAIQTIFDYYTSFRVHCMRSAVVYLLF